jgi:hypothetical protein
VALSPLVLTGLIVLGAGAAGDLTYHALDQGSVMFRSPSQQATHMELEATFGHDGSRAHLVTLAGMVVVVAGIAQRGLSNGRT